MIIGIAVLGLLIGFILGIRLAARIEAERLMRVVQAIRKELQPPLDDWGRALMAAKEASQAPR
jgi:hypothetical protein